MRRYVFLRSILWSGNKWPKKKAVGARKGKDILFATDRSLHTASQETEQAGQHVREAGEGRPAQEREAGMRRQAGGHMLK